MASVNKVILIGHLGADPESRTFQNGDKTVTMRIATSESWKDRDGNRQERTEWHTVAIFGPLTDVAERFLRKGSKVYVEGQLRTRKWQDRDGADRYSTEVVLQGPRAVLVMLDSREGRGSDGDQRGGENTGWGNRRGERRQPYGDDRGNRGSGFGSGGGGFADDLDDEIPF